MKDRDIQKKLNEYMVTPADESVIQKTISEGRLVLLRNPVQELQWYRRITNQFKYISPVLWIAQFAAFALCIALAGRMNNNTDFTAVLSAISFFMALLGVVGFPEVCKSFSYQMWELEQSCKYNLRQIVAIRLFLLGTIDLLIMLSITAMLSIQTQLPMWEMALYLFVPFNLACIISFFISDHARNKKSALPIFPAGLGIAFAMLICINRFSLYESISVPFWSVLCLGSAIVLFWKAVQFIRGMDEGGLTLCN